MTPIVEVALAPGEEREVEISPRGSGLWVVGELRAMGDLDGVFVTRARFEDARSVPVVRGGEVVRLTLRNTSGSRREVALTIVFRWAA